MSLTSKGAQEQQQMQLLEDNASLKERLGHLELENEELRRRLGDLGSVLACKVSGVPRTGRKGKRMITKGSPCREARSTRTPQKRRKRPPALQLIGEQEVERDSLFRRKSLVDKLLAFESKRPRNNKSTFKRENKTTAPKEYACRDCKRMFCRRGDRDNHERLMNHTKWTKGKKLELQTTV